MIEPNDSSLKKNRELEQANIKMEEMLIDVKQTNQKLKLTNENLAQALKSQDLFVACVSHELRNPLNAMLGNIELLQLEHMDISKKKMLKTCQICGEMLLVLINNILDVAKINASKLEINIGIMNMHSFVERIWGVSRVRIFQKGLSGQLVMSKEVPLWLKGDFYRLIQIILNLIGNATKFTTRGGVKVLIGWKESTGLERGEEMKNFNTGFDESATPTLSSKNKFLIPDEYGISEVNRTFQSPSNWSVQLERLNQMRWIIFSEKDDDLGSVKTDLKVHIRKSGILKIEVSDTGCGIAPEARAKLFEPFVQADPSITRKYGGTGLGLYIIKELVQKMNGAISLESEVNKGTKITIKIPLSTISAEEAQFSGENASMARKTSSEIKVKPALIVDDNPYNQNILKTYFKNLSIDTETAENGLEALNKVKSHPIGYYSMITMDIQMPVMDGITACKQIRQYEKQVKANVSLPIIIVTGNCSFSEQNECLSPYGEIRATYFFSKPFGYSDCKLCVESILARNQFKKVLIVDDDAFNRELLQVQVNRIGLCCETANDGLEALKKLKEGPGFGVVLMDFEMPGMNGIEVIKCIRNDPTQEHLFIIGTTGNTEETINRMSLSSGMNKILTKPISIQSLSSLFKDLKLI